IKKVCPQAIILPSDYESYSIFARRMYNIVRTFTPEVEEYSIDECFADLTGLQRPSRKSYEQLALEIKERLEEEVGVTFSIGLAPTKVVAKIGSSWNKPSGLVAIPGRRIHQYLENLPLREVWGVGSQTAAYLKKLEVTTALELAQKSHGWVKARLTKPHQEIWQELRGESVYKVETKKKKAQTVTRSRTFHPSSGQKEFLFARLVENLEQACAKLRGSSQATKKILFFLKTEDFSYRGGEVVLSVPTNIPLVLAAAVKQHLGAVFESGRAYRATGVVLTDLGELGQSQLDLFGQAERETKLRRVYQGLDQLEKKYSQAVTLAAQLPGREEKEKRPATNSLGKRLNIPFLGTAK
ncbi:DNA polymerase IV, partial [Patescibacteria group bacterium]|nr:DNA polymerase IV [Patescibacteria group bacterium]